LSRYLRIADIDQDGLRATIEARTDAVGLRHGVASASAQGDAKQRRKAAASHIPLPIRLASLLARWGEDESPRRCGPARRTRGAGQSWNRRGLPLSVVIRRSANDTLQQ